MVYFAYKNHAKTAYSLIFRSIDKDKFAIDVGCGSYNLPNYDEELEKFVEYIESTLINNH